MKKIKNSKYFHKSETMSSNDKVRIELEEGEEREFSPPVTPIVLTDPVFEVEEDEEPPYKKRRMLPPVPQWIKDFLISTDYYEPKSKDKRSKDKRAKSPSFHLKCDDAKPLKRICLSETPSPFHA